MTDEAEQVSLAYLQACAALERGEGDRARRELELLLMEFPRFAPAWDGLGRCWEAEGDLDEASTCYQKAIRLDRRNWRSRFHWGAALHRAGEHRQAAKLLREAARLAPTERLPLHYLGMSLAEQGCHADAMAAFRNALERPEREVRDAEILVRMAAVELDRGDLDAADTVCRRAALTAPEDPEVYYQWALVTLREGEPHDAERLAGRARALAPRSLRYLMLLVQLAEDRGDLDAARRHLATLGSERRRLQLALEAGLALRCRSGLLARRLALEALEDGGPIEDQAVDLALQVLRELRDDAGPCQGIRVVLEVDCDDQCYFRPYVVLARDEAQALEMVTELQALLDPAPWRIIETEQFRHQGEALRGICQVMLTRVLFPKPEE